MTSKAVLGVILAAASAVSAQAAYEINIVEDRGNVVAFGSGSLDTRGLTYNTSLISYSNIHAGSGSIAIGSCACFDHYFGASAVPFGVMGRGAGSFESFGPLVGIDSYGLMVPLWYVSGTEIGLSIATFRNTSFGTLGIVRGTYVVRWGSGDNADTLTIIAGSNRAIPIPPVPEPSAWALMIAAFGIVGAMMRKRYEGERRTHS
ncbi:PEPxxWA-CTERM sorting domain-containing protein [Qipengyuania sediminis]|uniref:PEPxxWA-CTERM sorting domain-containing protein n=1 Tax=Qipengyuania sediminis TaxID=1532023 RepID=UPI00105AB032|nr:PEPxxWA-CTERM sorting domain-containing protein [Qipengyuania sediminis]